jgi:5-methylcytosine-specific restriction endonuclease McrA
MRKKKIQSLKTWLIPKLRRISIYWPQIQKARDKAKVFLQIGLYKNGNPEFKRFFVCQNPDCGILCPNESDGAVDHIIPIVNIKDGFTNWDDYINSLFCDSNNLQFICKICHDNKTFLEDQQRILNKSVDKKK